MGRAGASISEAPMVDGAGRSPCAGCTFTENAIIDPGNTVDLNGRAAARPLLIFRRIQRAPNHGSNHCNLPWCGSLPQL